MRHRLSPEEDTRPGGVPERRNPPCVIREAKRALRAIETTFRSRLPLMIGRWQLKTIPIPCEARR